jgi:hypothetical protein
VDEDGDVEELKLFSGSKVVDERKVGDGGWSCVCVCALGCEEKCNDVKYWHDLGKPRDLCSTTAHEKCVEIGPFS